MNDCRFCGGIHYGTNPSKCPYKCVVCGGDIRDGMHGISSVGIPPPVCPKSILSGSYVKVSI
jgi:hypothetical protein